MTLPLVSVIIPTYNRAGIIAKTIDNVFDQTYRNIEVIVVDDGSIDGTEEVLQSYGGRIRWFSQRNAGPSAARNRGLEFARGEIIAFQDSDDLWHPSKIERQVCLLERAGESIPCCLCNVSFRSKQAGAETSFDSAPIKPQVEEGLWTNVAEVLATRFILFNQAAAIRRSVLERIGGFDETLKYLEDYELPLRIALEGPWGFIRTPLVYYGTDSGNSWSKQAYEEAVLLSECYVRVMESILQRLRANDGRKALVHLMEGRLRHAKRGLRIARMAHGKSSIGRVVATIASKVEHFRSVVDRRLPDYPKMQAQGLPPGLCNVAEDAPLRGPDQVAATNFQA